MRTTESKKRPTDSGPKRDGGNASNNKERKTERREDEPEWTENTKTEGVDTFAEMGLPLVLLDGKRLEIGEVVQVKGFLTTFRQERQLAVKRLRRMKDTNQEASWWSLMAEWKRTVLSKPWVIPDDVMAAVKKEQEKKEQESKMVEKRDSRRSQRRREWEEQHAVKEETKRSLQEEKMNKHALEGSNVLPMPWD